MALVLGLPAAALALTALKRGRRAGRGEPKAHTFAGLRSVGALFASMGAREHGCTASVVDSARGDLLLTAAHCVSGSGAGMVFAPDFHDGAAPYGRWVVNGAYLPSGWLRSQSSADDFAFLTVAPQQIGGRTTEIQQLTGGYRLGSSPAPGTRVTVPGYPAGGDTAPITCTARTYRQGGFPAFTCGGYVGGTSGSPWLARSSRGTAIVGVIGGLHQGGCRADVSYSSPLGASARAVYARANRGADADVAPNPDPDGCS